MADLGRCTCINLKSFIPFRDNSPGIGVGAAQIVELSLLKIDHHCEVVAHTYIPSEKRFDGLMWRFLTGA